MILSGPIIIYLLDGLIFTGKKLTAKKSTVVLTFEKFRYKMNDEPTDLLLIGDSMISKLKTGIAQNIFKVYFYP